MGKNWKKEGYRVEIVANRNSKETEREKKMNYYIIEKKNFILELFFIT